MSNFRVGQKVVCVDDRREAYSIPGIKYSGDGLDGLTKGEIYTVKLAYTSSFCLSGACVVVNEINRCWRDEENTITGEQGYDIARFRPLIETDISIFKAILANPHKELETVE